MRSFVITIVDNPKSVASAQRCIDSGKQFGHDVEMWNALTPQNIDVFQAAAIAKIRPNQLKETYSHFESCVAAFLSHMSLWELCVKTQEEVQIFEHDAVFVNSVPNFINYAGCLNLGAPSYGKYNTPTMLGVNPLTSKRYFPGAHAYRLKPQAAKLLIQEAQIRSRPTDVFLHVDTFPWLEEYYPWPVKCMDSFTTIQKHEGCLAKHNYGKDYDIQR
jgi:GR25 family glycosyltransferase involved in LPS biosynthesis